MDTGFQRGEKFLKIHQLVRFFHQNAPKLQKFLHFSKYFSPNGDFSPDFSPAKNTRFDKLSLKFDKKERLILNINLSIWYQITSLKVPLTLKLSSNFLHFVYVRQALSVQNWLKVSSI